MARILVPHLARIALVWLVATAVYPGIADARQAPRSPQPSVQQPSAALRPLALQSETWAIGSDAAGRGCLGDGEAHDRAWAGALDGTFSATETLCEYTTDGRGPGRLGIEAHATVSDGTAEIWITAPDGTTRRGGLVAQTPVGPGGMEREYAVCVTPRLLVSADTFARLEGGTWRIWLTAGAGDVALEVRAFVMPPEGRRAACPEGERNLEQ